MWKFQEFAIIQILREINCEHCRSAKSAIITHLQALNFEFDEFLHFLKVAIYQISKIQSSKNDKNSSFRASRFSKISVTENFHNMNSRFKSWWYFNFPSQSKQKSTFLQACVKNLFSKSYQIEMRKLFTSSFTTKKFDLYVASLHS